MTENECRIVKFLVDGEYHLSLAELQCHDRDRTCYPIERLEDGTLERLCQMFEHFRARCGHYPLRVNCAFRTEAHNAEVGGGAKSQHLEGKALDIAIPVAHIPKEDFWNYALDFAEGYEALGGLGLYWSFVHMDIRPRKPSGGIARWDYRRKR